ncbi:hypothetical protein FHG87_004363 [Trinorchestia longiramus]|nr:hypothetical protein FHG87_004363 [Trinorchestia longiramus]
MAFPSVLTVLAVVASASAAQHSHLQSLQEPHLPRDHNVIAATQKFLQQFATLQAKAAAAPDVSVHKKVPVNSANSGTKAPQIITGILPEEPINTAIRQLHKQLKPGNKNINLSQSNDPHRSASQRPQQHFQQPQHQFQKPKQQQFHHPQQLNQQQQQQQRQHQNPPNNHFQMQLFHHPQQLQQRQSHQQPQQQQQQPQQKQPQQQFNTHNFTPVRNQFGHVINPNRYPGPLADDLPAAVGGPLQQVGPTAAVHEAQQRLAQAHMAILAHHATLPQTPPPEKQKKA